MELCQGVEISALLLGHIHELDSYSQPIVFARPGVADLSPKLHGQDDPLPSRLFGSGIKALEAGSGRGHIDDAAVAPTLHRIAFDHVLATPVRELSRQKPSYLFHPAHLLLRAARIRAPQQVVQQRAEEYRPVT